MFTPVKQLNNKRTIYVQITCLMMYQVLNRKITENKELEEQGEVFFPH